MFKKTPWTKRALGLLLRTRINDRWNLGSTSLQELPVSVPHSYFFIVSLNLTLAASTYNRSIRGHLVVEVDDMLKAGICWLASYCWTGCCWISCCRAGCGWTGCWCAWFCWVDFCWCWWGSGGHRLKMHYEMFPDLWWFWTAVALLFGCAAGLCWQDWAR